MVTLTEANGDRQSDRQQPGQNVGESEPSPWYDLWAQSLMALWAFLQLVLTGVGIWYIRKTLVETEKAVIEAVKATKAAQDAVDVTRLSAEKQLRAYVGVASVDCEEPTPGEMSVTVTLKNFGQTPAYGMKIRCGLGAAPDYPAQPTLNAPGPPSDMMPQGATVMPFFMPISSGPFAQALAGKFKMWMVGEATYTDAFGDPQTLAFQYRWSPAHGRFGPAVDFSTET